MKNMGDMVLCSCVNALDICKFLKLHIRIMACEMCFSLSANLPQTEYGLPILKETIKISIFWLCISVSLSTATEDMLAFF